MERVYERDEQGRRYYQLDEQHKFISMIGAFWGILTMPIDMTDADSFRKKFQEKSGTRVTTTALLVKATANALENFPIIGGV